MADNKNFSNSDILTVLNSLTLDKPNNLVYNNVLSVIIPEIIHIKNSALKIEYANKLIDKNNMSAEVIAAALQSLNKKKKILLDTMLEIPDLDPKLIGGILESTTFISHDGPYTSSYRIKFAIKLLKNKEFPKEEISNIIRNLYGTNGLKCAQYLYNKKDFPNNLIGDILNALTFAPFENLSHLSASYEKYRANLVHTLAEDSSFPDAEIAPLLRVLRKSAISDFEKFYKDTNIPRDEISNILVIQRGMKKGVKKLGFAERVEFLINAVKIEDNTKTYLKKYGIEKSAIDKMVQDISLDMGMNKVNIKTLPECQQKFLKNLIANNNPAAEHLLKNVHFEEYKNGLPLKYSRKAFLSDINSILSGLSSEDKTYLMQKYNLTIENNELESFPVISGTEQVPSHLKNAALQLEAKIREFTLNNEVKSDNAELNDLFNSIVKGFPEFTTIIGKKQHATHAYTLDIHTLKVLQSAMNDPMYAQLSDRAKTVLKYAILMHDIGKQANVKDPLHYETSAKHAVGILDKFNLPADVKAEIIEAIYNHHWFAEYNKGNIGAEKVNALFRSDESLQIGLIMAKADLRNVNGSFHLDCTHTKSEQAFEDYMNNKFMLVRNASVERSSRTNILMPSRFEQTSQRHFPMQSVIIDGNEYKIPVLNLTDDSISENLSQYGFDSETTKDNARFIVHMNDKIQGLQVFMALSSSPATHSVQSLSMISKNNTRVYQNQTYGVVADVDAGNVSYAYYQNLASGTKKDFNSFAKWIFKNGNDRTYVRDKFLNILKEHGIELSNTEYGELSAKVLEHLKYKTQVENVKIGNKEIPADVLKSAIEQSRDALFKGGDIHSEIVALNPRAKALVARVNSIAECSKEFIEFARKNNLPIILIGSKIEH